MRRLFADTFFFFAYLNSGDVAHRAAEEYFDVFDGELVTTESVLTELADGLARTPDRRTFVDFHCALRDDPSVKIVPSSADLFATAINLYAQRPDKDWSLTDCISFVVMEREQLTEALTGDHHFEQAGFRALLRG